MIRKIKLWFERIWVRLTWAHLVSLNPKDPLIKEGVWYNVSYSMKREGKEIWVDELRVYEVKE